MITTTGFEFEPLDDNPRTPGTITESSWKPTIKGAKNAFGTCEGWTGMLATLTVWVEHAINLMATTADPTGAWQQCGQLMSRPADVPSDLEIASAAILRPIGDAAWSSFHP